MYNANGVRNNTNAFSLLFFRLFVGIKLTGTMPKPLTTSKFSF